MSGILQAGTRRSTWCVANRLTRYGPSRQCVTDDIVTYARTVRPRVRCIDPPALAAAILAVRMSSRRMGYQVAHAGEQVHQMHRPSIDF